MRTRHHASISVLLSLAGLFLGVFFSHAQPSNVVANSLLTTAAQVRALSPEAAARQRPVRLRGVSLGQVAPNGSSCVIVDETEGIYLRGDPGFFSAVQRGDLIEVEGVTDPGGFAPFVLPRAIHKLGKGNLPPPQVVSLGDLSNESLDAQWVEVTGVVRNCEPLPSGEPPTPPPGRAPGNESDANVFILDLVSGSERVAVQVNEKVEALDYVDAQIRVQGICFSQHSASRQFLRPLLLVPRGAALNIERPPLKDPFNTQARPVESLLEFSRQSNFGHRVHVSGVVTHHRPGEFLWLREGDRGLRVQSKQKEVLRVGDLVDVLGFPIRGQYTPVLEDAVFRKKATAAAPVPISPTNAATALKYDANLVQLKAMLLEKRQLEDGWLLTLGWEEAQIEAVLHLPKAATLPSDWLKGSTVLVSGICSVINDKSGPVSGVFEPRSFQVLLRSPADLTVLYPPSWWTREHVMVLLGLAAALSLLVTTVITLGARRHVREVAMRRATAEAEFAAILSERNRMAREMHDTLAQGLAATSVRLRLARKHANGAPQALSENLDAAQQLVSESLEEARNSIWNMRSHILESRDLAGALNGILEQLTQGTGVKTHFKVIGKSRRFAPMVENNLLRIGQEAIANATKHSRANDIAVRLQFGARQFQLSVEDDGQGFDPARPPSSQGGFGLVGMRERSEILHGDLKVASLPGHGTKIILCIPAPGE